MPEKIQKTDAEWRRELTPEQYHVLREKGTERAFSGELAHTKQPGDYVCAGCGKVLFRSDEKFESGSGWPSFWSPVEDDAVETEQDRSYGMVRTEVKCSDCGGHLGHVFDDGPAPTGQRYCMNSAALRFVPVEKLEEDGYGQYLSLFGKAPTGEARGGAPGKPNVPGGAPAKPVGATKAASKGSGGGRREVAVLAGGCFWGMEEILRGIPGVVETIVGYTGGTTPNATYEDVHTGKTGHAESVRIVFDPDRLSYEDLLGWFFRMHDPTTPNRQGNDVGTQYRSAIFYENDEQRRVAEKVKASVEASGKWKRPITTEIVAATEFWPAEEYHQNYLQKHPGGYTCHYLRD